MTGGISQGSMLRPQIFTMYINDLEKGTEGRKVSLEKSQRGYNMI